MGSDNEIKPILEAVYDVHDDLLFDALFEHAYIRHYNKGELLVRVGEIERTLMLLVTGTARMFLNDGDEEKTLLFFAEPGGWVRVMGGLIDAAKSICNVDMVEEGDILCIPVSDFGEVVRAYPQLQSVYRSELEKSILDRTNEKLMLYKSNEERYQWFLNKYPGLIDKVEHYKIASYLGMSPVTLSRIRKKAGKRD